MNTDKRMALRAHQLTYCAQRDLLQRLYITGHMDYATLVAWVLCLQEELDLHADAVRETMLDRTVPPYVSPGLDTAR